MSKDPGVDAGLRPVSIWRARPGRLAKEARSMLRSIRLALCGLAFLAAAGGDVRSQYYYPSGYGYGGYGFGGWGGTPQGDVLQGMGTYAEAPGSTTTTRPWPTRSRPTTSFDSTVPLQLADRGPPSLQHPPGSQASASTMGATRPGLADAHLPDPGGHRFGRAAELIVDQLTDPKVMNDFVGPPAGERPGQRGGGRADPLPRRDRRHHDLARRADRPRDLAAPAPLRSLQARARGVSEGR